MGIFGAIKDRIVDEGKEKLLDIKDFWDNGIDKIRGVDKTILKLTAAHVFPQKFQSMLEELENSYNNLNEEFINAKDYYSEAESNRESTRTELEYKKQEFRDYKDNLSILGKISYKFPPFRLLTRNGREYKRLKREIKQLKKEHKFWIKASEERENSLTSVDKERKKYKRLISEQKRMVVMKAKLYSNEIQVIKDYYETLDILGANELKNRLGANRFQSIDAFYKFFQNNWLTPNGCKLNLNTDDVKRCSEFFKNIRLNMISDTEKDILVNAISMNNLRGRINVQLNPSQPQKVTVQPVPQGQPAPKGQPAQQPQPNGQPAQQPKGQPAKQPQPNGQPAQQPQDQPVKQSPKRVQAKQISEQDLVNAVNGQPGSNSSRREASKFADLLKRMYQGTSDMTLFGENGVGNCYKKLHNKVTEEGVYSAIDSLIKKNAFKDLFKDGKHPKDANEIITMIGNEQIQKLPPTRQTDVSPYFIGLLTIDQVVSGENIRLVQSDAAKKIALEIRDRRKRAAQDKLNSGKENN